MPFVKDKYNRTYSPQDRTYHRELVWKNAVKLFEKRNGMTPKSIINTQKAFIHNLQLSGKNKYKTIDILQNYLKNPNKIIAEQIFWTSIYSKIKE